MSSASNSTFSLPHSSSHCVSKNTSHDKAAKIRPRTAISTLGYVESRQVICAISESRGISPTVGLAFVDLETSRVVLCQLCDSQTYVKTLQKLHVYRPSEILLLKASSRLQSSCKLTAIIEDTLAELDCVITLLDRQLWSENKGLDYIQKLAFAEDLEAIKIAVVGSYFAICCLAAALNYVESINGLSFHPHSLHMKFEPSEGSMMIDISTMASLELIQNLRQPKSKNCFLGLMDATQTPMGSRLLRNNIMQPLTNSETLELRYDALEELVTKEEMLFGVRQALKGLQDSDKLLTNLAFTGPSSFETLSQNVNSAIIVRTFLDSIQPVFEALSNSQSHLLIEICQLCLPQSINPIRTLVNETLNDDIKYSNTPLNIKNQQVFAVKAGVNGLLDVTRQAYKENSDDIYFYVNELSAKHELAIALKYDEPRHYYLSIASDEELHTLVSNSEFINVVKKRKHSEASTLDLLKRNQKIIDSYQETILLSTGIITNLIVQLKQHLSVLFKVSEAIAMLDMLSAFAQFCISQSCVRPKLGETLAIQSCRHPVKEKLLKTKFVPNDVFASHQSRFQIVTGSNMSGKSTYIRSVALAVITAQIGCFVPATYAMIPIHHQLFARTSADDNSVANVSTFSTEMQEMAYILRNVHNRSVVVIDELGRGTSSRDGMAIAIAIAEALVESKALVWFATHFSELAQILGDRVGVVSLHLAVDNPDPETLHMLYSLRPGPSPTNSYGLTISRVFPLPKPVIHHAEVISREITERMTSRKNQSRSRRLARRRRLILVLHEHLKQALRGHMNDETLQEWLEMLRAEFVENMTELGTDTLVSLHESSIINQPVHGDELALRSERSSDLPDIDTADGPGSTRLTADEAANAENLRPRSNLTNSSNYTTSSEMLLG